jgi:glutamine cyclotransferase
MQPMFPAVFVALLLWLAPCMAWTDAPAPIAVPQVRASYPHDPNAYTQGLLWHDGLLYESTGRYGHSTLSARKLESGEAVLSTTLPDELFGEGLARVGDELLQLTWKEGQVLVYEAATLRLKRVLPYGWDGWGAAYDGRQLIVSDGSAVLRFLDPENLTELRQVTVHDGDRQVVYLNELEYLEGEIYANVYGSDRIARIAPASGKVVGWLDLSELYPVAQRASGDAVLNGIAYDAERRVLLVTGKFWPRVFVIALPEP